MAPAVQRSQVPTGDTRIVLHLTGDGAGRCEPRTCNQEGSLALTHLTGFQSSLNHRYPTRRYPGKRMLHQT
jgi:hypothetical protein